MGLTSSLFAGLSGMKTNEFRMDVIGNNIANVNTHAFKSQRVTFQSQFSSTFSFGSAPSATIGGTNPVQIGSGSMVGGMARDFSVGAPESTGLKTDLAVQGQGLFILEKADGSQIFSRDGSFAFNKENFLVSQHGLYLSGYGIDSNFNIVEGQLDRIRIPIGEITTAATTSFAQFSGNLDANQNVKAANTRAAEAIAGTDPTLVPRTVLTSQVLYSDLAATVPAVAATALTSLYNAAGQQLFANGNVINLAEANKGGANLAVKQFTVGTTGTTYGELATWLEGVLGINTSANLIDMTALSADYNPGANIGSSAPADDGTIRIVGNIGHENNIILGSKAITVEQGTAAGVPPVTTPFQFASSTASLTTTDELKAKLGESIRTSFRAYDSLGNPMNINVTMVKETTNNGGHIWRYFAESPDDSKGLGVMPDTVLGTGTIVIDSFGQFLSATDQVISIDRADTGASTPQSITLDFSRMNGFKLPSAMSLLSQDGFQSGTLQDYSIGQDGVIVGSFDNGLTRDLGQVVLATFRNYEGLVSQEGNLFKGGPNSGNSLVKKPLELGAGSIQSAALELSNVDLSREFINLIISSTGFSASSRVIQTSDRLLNELIALSR